MIVLNYLIEQLVEFVVRIVRACIHTNAWVLVCNSREDAKLEGDTFFAGLVFVLVPDFFCKTSFARRCSAFIKEVIEVNEVFRSFVTSVELVLWFFHCFVWTGVASHSLIHVVINSWLIVNASSRVFHLRVEITAAHLTISNKFGCSILLSCGCTITLIAEFHIIVKCFNFFWVPRLSQLLNAFFLTIQNQDDEDCNNQEFDTNDEYDSQDVIDLFIILWIIIRRRYNH